MSTPSPSPSAEDFDQTPWAAVVAAVAGGRDYEYANAFHQAAEEARSRGDASVERVFRLLGDICSFVLHPGHPRQPFRAAASSAFRTVDPGDVDPDALSVFGGVVPSVEDPWLRARLADFAWTFGGDYRMARVAVDSYLQLAEDLTVTDRWTQPLRALTRAVEIARRLGPKGGAVEQVAEFSERVLDQVRTRDGMLPHALLQLGAKHRLGDPVHLHETAAAIAAEAEQAEDWERAERYWQAAEDLAGNAGDPTKRIEALARQGETYARRAVAVADLPHIGKIRAAAYLERAIEVFRRAGMRERSEELQRLMLDYQRAIPADLIAMPVSVPIEDAVRAARDAVTGKSLQIALLELALLVPIPDFATLKQQSEANVDRFLFRRMFPAVQLNADGKVVGREDALNASTADGREAAIRVEMLQAGTRLHRAFGEAMVLPALAQITEEHLVLPEDFFWLVSNNPLVPAGREMLYAEAFQAAFDGDPVKAIHILVLQMEHSIREVLERRGVLVTSLKDGIQMERGLNQLLYTHEIRDYLGEDLVFGLQCLLVEKFGSDLRNRVAHGLMHSHEFREPECFYCWWFCYRVVCEPVIRALRGQQPPSSGGDGDQENAGERMEDCS